MESTQLIKMFGLLESLADHPQGRPLVELAAESGVAKPTAHRILNTLASLGYVERVSAGLYRQAPDLLRLVQGSDDRALIAAAETPLRKLHKKTKETVNLGVLRQARVKYLVVLESPQPLRRIVDAQMTDPFACTALGRAIVSHLPLERQSFLLKNCVLERRTAKTLIDPQKIKQVLAHAAMNGYAIEEEETDLGVICIGAPILQHGNAIAAVSLTVPTARVNELNRKLVVEWVQETAQIISQLMPGETSR